MRTFYPALLCLTLLLLSISSHAQPKINQPQIGTIEIARAKVYPALVNINVVVRYFSGGRVARAPAGGSGVVVSPDGYVLTNFHVAGHTTHITCTLANGEVIEARVVADDPLSDLSVLKLRLDKRVNPKAPIAYAKLADSDQLQIGQSVLAMGNPLMLSSSMTLGIVSNTKRVFTDFTGTQIEDMELEQGEKSGTFTRWIQHDALILPGNSGGPLVNLSGEVVGINELGGNGVGFAIPSNMAKFVLSQVLAHGKVQRGWLGLTVMPVDKLGRTTGALVSSVFPDSPATKAGILPGDLILSVNNTPAKVQFFEQVPLFYQSIAQIPLGQKAFVKVLRNGKMQMLTAVVSPMQSSVGEEYEFRTMGLTVQALTQQMALTRHLPDATGVLVTGVRPGYPFESAQPAISSGDVVRSVDGIPTPTVEAFRKAVSLTEKSKKASFSVALQRRDEQLLAIVKTDTDKNQDDSGELPQAWLGVRTQVVTQDVADALGLTDTTGFRITQVFPYTEASHSGLMPGDIITALNGSTLDASHLQDAGDLNRAIQQLTVGESAKLTVLRGKAKQEITVKLEPSPTSVAQAKTSRSKEFDFAVRDITLMDKIRNHWTPAQKGVLVTDSTMGGWANIAGLHADDLIVSINGSSVDSVSDFDLLMPKIIKKQPKVIKIFVRRDYQTQFIFVEPDWSKLIASE